MIHTTLLSTGIPSAEDLSSDFMVTLTRVSITGITVVCVNLFVLISGWFGINPKGKKLAALIFQLGFFIVICLIYGFFRQGSMSISEMLRTVRLYNMWWFVKSYILLYFLSPVLNAFCEHATKKEFALVLMAFYCFSSVSWLIHFVDWMANGYCTMSFVGLYLLARFIKLHLSGFIASVGKWWMFFAYILFSLLTIMFYYIQTVHDIMPLWNREIFGYDSPFVILAALSLLLLFSKIRIRSNIINWIAKSCFAVYLLHTGNYIFPDFKAHLSQYYQNHSYWIYLPYSIVFSVFVFAIGILIDKIRIMSWNLIARKR